MIRTPHVRGVSPLSFEELYRAHATAVYRFVLFLSGDFALADDLTSETFLRVWTASGPIRESSVRSYLLSIARNLVIDHARRKRSADLPPDLPARTNVEHEAQSRDELRRVLDAMARLDPDDRAALLLRVEHNLPYEEIASIVGITPASARVKICRIRARLAAARTGVTP